MTYIIIAEPGIEEEVSEELRTRFKVSKTEFEEGSGYLEFEATPNQIYSIIYKAQTIKHVLLKAASGKFKDKEDLLNNSGITEDFLNNSEEKIFSTTCERIGKHEFRSPDITHLIHKQIRKFKDTDYNSNAIVHVHIKDNHFATGLRINQKDLSKRQYKIFNHPNSINATIGAAMLIAGNIKKDTKIIDPFSLGGILPIEAALMQTETPVNFFEKNMKITQTKEVKQEDFEKIIKELNKKIDSKPKNIISMDAHFSNISAQKKNAKIAGTEKNIEFSKNQAEDIDLKTKDAQLICTRPIETSKHVSENLAKNIQSKFLERTKDAITKNAKIVLLLRKPHLLKEEAKNQKYKILKEKEINQGKEIHTMLILGVEK